MSEKTSETSMAQPSQAMLCKEVKEFEKYREIFSSQKPLNALCECGFRCSADCLIHDFTVFEKEQVRYRLNAVRNSRLRILVNIDFHEAQTTFILGDKLL
jgi:hypothetical protein